MFHFSKEVDYTFQLTIALAKLDSGEYLSLRKFSQESNISFLFLQKIARSLRKSGIIGSLRGAHGGYFLKRKPENITLKEIIEIIDGPSGVVGCLRKGGFCPNKNTCTARNVFKYVNNKFINSISEKKLAEFI
ncbi:MAG: Rrf2 family transcriptional regulator [Candidatus Magasanikbacteria bacterium]|nr:Rrf2 family transcriptional regulator [Candidatus Magasanikbacteria bacterium]